MSSLISSGAESWSALSSSMIVSISSSLGTSPMSLNVLDAVLISAQKASMLPPLLDELLFDELLLEELLLELFELVDLSVEVFALLLPPPHAPRVSTRSPPT